MPPGPRRSPTAKPWAAPRAPQGPVDAAAVESRLVGAVDTDRAPAPRVAVAAPRNGARLHGEPVAVEVLEVRVVEKQKVAPAGMATLVDDHVEARRRAQVTL